MSVLINILIKCFSQPKSLFFSPDFGEIRTFSWAWALCLLCQMGKPALVVSCVSTLFLCIAE